MKNMKKLVSIILVTAFSMTLLVGCGHNHVWQEATCAAPRTCADCGETEGEALPHTWVEATCAAPKSCTVCGATEGEALPHTLTEANYQSPAVCTVCGAEVGDPVPGVFAERNYNLMVPGTTYDCLATGYNDRSYVFTATVSADNYRIVPSDDTHQAKDGFEWRIVDLNFTFSDPIVERDGYFYATKVMSYYIGFDKTGIVNYNGEEYQCALQRETIHKEQVSLDTVNEVYEVAVQVPVGYDGMVVCIYNPALSIYATGVDIETFEELEKTSPLFFRFN